ncbi:MULTISPECIES: type IV secretion system protein [Alcaligenaceae]|uniref:type IV secretion system protein n=1 Tax=Alcaligenaceae TaxID=506 RepID=UPI00049EA854|nr:type IV secretion system protein [Bordetella bronchiseptica]AWQ06160.1 type IV secretion system family protein [Bordetella bronchiseptica]KDD61763.1 type IV secretion system protein [Bordetella bronchiseptica OSU553]
MTTVKKLAAAAIFSLMASSISYAQIPVTDAAQIAKSTAEHAEQILKWVEQIRQMEQQYKQMEREFESITGARGMGQLLNQATRLSLPDGFENNYLNLIQSGAAGASPEARAIYDAIKQLGCSTIEGQSARATCEAKAYAQPENAAYIESAINQARDRANDLQQLISQVDAAPDMKAATDLANRIAAEQAMLQNEQTTVNLALAQRQAQDALIAQKQSEDARKRLLENTSNPINDFLKSQ